MTDSAKTWSSRFTQPMDALMVDFNASCGFDYRLAPFDIEGSKAHIAMLCKVGVLSASEKDTLIKGLDGVLSRIEKGDFSWDRTKEDVHMNIEAALVDAVGEVGKKVHTARSRNDQVATDMRLYVRDRIDAVLGMLDALQSAILAKAEEYADAPMPGFTHLQSAQPITFGFHLMAWHAMIDRDKDRLRATRERANVCPLGSGALAGTSFPVDRDYVAELLGFRAPCPNAMDAVSDRDFVIDFVYDLAMVLMHFSRWSEELILWSSTPFHLVDIEDRYCTGSSIMPQKKNPDIPELVRGKCGRVYGHVFSLLTVMKAQPLAYNKDNQEDKEPLFDAVATAMPCIRLLTGLIASLRFNRERGLSLAGEGFATATDLADYLVRKGMPFREAHGVVAVLVRLAIEKGKDLSELSLDAMQEVSSLLEKDVYEVLTVEGSIGARAHKGGTAPDAVRAMIKEAKDRE